MTVSRTTPLLFSFRTKIEEAVNLVPRMPPESKLKAVQFWNIVSEKLQDIVNNSAADISAIALNMEETNACSDKLNMEMNSSTNYIVPASTSDFMNISQNYAMFSESGTQFQSADLYNTDLKQLPPSSSVPSNMEELPPNNEITHIPHAHNLNAMNNTLQSESEINQQLLDIANISSNSENFTQNIHSSEISNTNIRTSNSNLFPKDLQNIQESDVNLGQLTQNKEQNCNSFNCNTKICDNSSNPTTQKEYRRSSARLKEAKKKIDYNIDNSSDSYSGNGSNIDTDFDPHHCLSDSKELTAECKDRPFSNIKKLVGSEDSRQHQNYRDDPMHGDEKEIYCSDSSCTCKVCNKTFQNPESLSKHSSSHEKPYSCTDCQATFSSRGNLSVHMRKHTGEKPYKCDECGSRFSTQGNLKRHVKTHSGEKPWKCDQCGSCFTEKKSLTVHMRRHTGERPYECTTCGKRFAQTGILQTHIAMHLNIKVHLCELCGKSFRQKSQLRIHRLRHDNVRKYGCKSCKAFFLTKGDLERHVRQHTGVKPFTCSICKKTFTRQQSLNEHMNRHYGLKPYECNYCNKRFVEMSACYKHVKLHTNPGDIEGWKKNALKINHTEEISQPEVIPEAGNTENELPSIQEGPQYFAVVLNSKDPCVENNQTILFNPTSHENGIITNGLGVLTTINVLPDASTVPLMF